MTGAVVGGDVASSAESRNGFFDIGLAEAGVSVAGLVGPEAIRFLKGLFDSRDEACRSVAVREVLARRAPDPVGTRREMVECRAVWDKHSILSQHLFTCAIFVMQARHAVVGTVALLLDKRVKIRRT